jgi:hypothetical protein
MSELKVTIVAVLVLVALLSGAMFLTVELVERACSARWEDSGFKHRYSFFGGCQIQLPNNIWIPAANYREQ